MKSSLTDAMRAAANLTKAGRLGQATREIQQAMGAVGRQSASGEPDKAPLPRELELVANTEPGSSDAEARASAKPANPSEGSSTRWKRWSLGDTVGMLRQAKAGLISTGHSAGTHSRGHQDPELATRVYSCTAGNRQYELFAPSGRVGASGLVVMLHGCTQDGRDFAAGSRMNEHARANRLIVAYPNQPRSANASSCWNWFNPKDQTRAGEPAILAGIAEELIGEFDIDPARIFVAGLSAGGAMAVAAGALYPDVFSAVGVHSGLPFRIAHNVVSALDLMRNGPGARSASAAADSTRIRTIVFQGDADPTVHPSNAARIIEDQRLARGREERSRGTSQQGRAWTRRLMRNDSQVNMLEAWEIDGGGHAWSGGSAEGSHTDPAGPDASREMVRFFLEPTRG